MLGTTTTATGANANDCLQQQSSLPSSTNLKCSSCQVYLRDDESQRGHSKEPWHIYNVKRRIASLPPITLEIFQTEIQKQAIDKASSSSDDISSSNSSISDSSSPATDSLSEPASPFTCLFCIETFSQNESGLNANLTHMLKAHGLFVPSPERIINLETFLGYLATEVREWHECLYCGATKTSTLSVQAHMKDKNHCALNLEREPELCEFWEDATIGGTVVDGIGAGPKEPKSTDPETRIVSGRVITSRRTIPSKKRPATSSQTNALSLPVSQNPSSSPPRPQPSPQPQSNTTHLTRTPTRAETSLQGLLPHQHQALVLAEKKAQRSEAVARRAREWASAKGANTQKHDQFDSTKIGIRGKQNHKLMPR